MFTTPLLSLTQCFSPNSMPHQFDHGSLWLDSFSSLPCAHVCQHSLFVLLWRARRARGIFASLWKVFVCTFSRSAGGHSRCLVCCFVYCFVSFLLLFVDVLRFVSLEPVERAKVPHCWIDAIERDSRPFGPKRLLLSIPLGPHTALLFFHWATCAAAHRSRARSAFLFLFPTLPLSPLPHFPRPLPTPFLNCCRPMNPGMGPVH